MNTTHVQMPSTIQNTANSKAASVLDSSSQSEVLQRKADMANNAAQRAEAPRPNNTGMPDNLKAGIESLSGFSMDEVRVHYNSSKPATVQALAYTQGTDIHVAPGQEKHLPHEAWHVAQQMAGRVSPTTNINGMPVNDNAGLEHEADVMGEKASKVFFYPNSTNLKKTQNHQNINQFTLKEGILNVIGEEHDESDSQREIEKNFIKEKIHSDFYKHEYEFMLNDKQHADSPWLIFAHRLFYLNEFTNNFNSLADYLSDFFSSKKSDPISELKNKLLPILNDFDTTTFPQALKQIDEMHLVYNDYKNEIPYEIDLSKIKPALTTSRNHLKNIISILQGKKIILSKLRKPFTNFSLSLKTAFQLIKKIFIFVDTFKSIDEVRTSRSTMMHYAANTNFSQPGVWKIGDKHVADIKTDFSENERNYNLIYKVEFYDEMAKAGLSPDSRIDSYKKILKLRKQKELMPNDWEKLLTEIRSVKKTK